MLKNNINNNKNKYNLKINIFSKYNYYYNNKKLIYYTLYKNHKAKIINYNKKLSLFRIKIYNLNNNYKKSLIIMLI